MTAPSPMSGRPEPRVSCESEQHLQQQIIDALENQTPLAIQGAGSKAFLAGQ